MNLKKISRVVERVLGLISETKPIILISIGIAIKLGVSLYFASISNPSFPEKWFATSGDTEDYIEPIENLYKTGLLYTELHNHAILHRMPGFLPFYLPLRFFLSETASLNALAVIQSILSGISCYVLALIAAKFFTKHKDKIFSITFLIALISITNSIFDRYILSESLSSSLLIFSLYILQSALTRKKNSFFLIAGGLMTFTIFLKPYFIFIQLYFLLFLLFVNRKSPFKAILKNSLSFVLVTTICLGAWSTYFHHMKGEWLLLQKSDAHKSSLGLDNAPFEMMKEAVRVTGGQFTEWDPDGAMYALVNINAEFSDDLFPDAFFSPTFNRNDLNAMRHKYDEMLNSQYPENKKNIGISITSDLRSAIAEYEKNQIVDRHILSRIRAFGRFYFQRGAVYIPFPKRENQNIIQLAIKAFYTLFYWLIMIVGSIGLFRNVFVRPNQFGYFFGGITGFVLALFPIVLIASEQRYIAIAYVMIIPFVAQLLSQTEPERVDSRSISK